MGFGGFCVIFVGFVNFVCFNGFVVAFCVLYDFAVGFVIFFYRVGVVLLWLCVFFDLFCGLCPCGVVGCVFVLVVRVAFLCVCVMDCGSPVGADL